MKRLMILAGILAILSAPMTTWAQTASTSRARLKPFTSENMIAKVDYAEAIRTCDRRILNVKCERLVELANSRFNLGLNLSELSAGAARTEVAEFIENLEEVPCAQSRATTLAAAMPNGDIKEKGVTRTMQPNERCLYDSNHGLWVASLMCGNFITDDNLAGVFPSEGNRRLTDQFNDAARQAGNQADATEGGRGSSRYADRDRRGSKKNFWESHKKKIVGGTVGGLALYGLLSLLDMNDVTVKNTNIQNNPR